MITITSSIAGLVKKYPTTLHVLCHCGHQATVATFIDKPVKLVCSRCGNRDPIVAARDRTRAWASRRRGK